MLKTRPLHTKSESDSDNELEPQKTVERKDLPKIDNTIVSQTENDIDFHVSIDTDTLDNSLSNVILSDTEGDIDFHDPIDTNTLDNSPSDVIDPDLHTQTKEKNNSLFELKNLISPDSSVPDTEVVEHYDTAPPHEIYPDLNSVQIENVEAPQKIPSDVPSVKYHTTDLFDLIMNNDSVALSAIFIDPMMLSLKENLEPTSYIDAAIKLENWECVEVLWQHYCHYPKLQSLFIEKLEASLVLISHPEKMSIQQRILLVLLIKYLLPICFNKQENTDFIDVATIPKSCEDTVKFSTFLQKAQLTELKNLTWDEILLHFSRKDTLQQLAQSEISLKESEKKDESQNLPLYNLLLDAAKEKNKPLVEHLLTTKSEYEYIRSFDSTFLFQLIIDNNWPDILLQLILKQDTITHNSTFDDLTHNISFLKEFVENSPKDKSNGLSYSNDRILDLWLRNIFQWTLTNEEEALALTSFNLYPALLVDIVFSSHKIICKKNMLSILKAVEENIEQTIKIEHGEFDDRKSRYIYASMGYKQFVINVINSGNKQCIELLFSSLNRESLTIATKQEIFASYLELIRCYFASEVYCDEFGGKAKVITWVRTNFGFDALIKNNPRTSPSNFLDKFKGRFIEFNPNADAGPLALLNNSAIWQAFYQHCKNNLNDNKLDSFIKWVTEYKKDKRFQTSLTTLRQYYNALKFLIYTEQYQEQPEKLYRLLPPLCSETDFCDNPFFKLAYYEHTKTQNLIPCLKAWNVGSTTQFSGTVQDTIISHSILILTNTHSKERTSAITKQSCTWLIKQLEKNFAQLEFDTIIETCKFSLQQPVFPENKGFKGFFDTAERKQIKSLQAMATKIQEKCLVYCKEKLPTDLKPYIGTFLLVNKTQLFFVMPPIDTTKIEHCEIKKIDVPKFFKYLEEHGKNTKYFNMNTTPFEVLEIHTFAMPNPSVECHM